MFLSEIISYPDLVAREKANLQKGMNFGIRPGYSIILMSVRRGAPYHDRIDHERGLLIYEGHDVPRTHAADPKTVDQPISNSSGSPTENGKFYRAAKDAANTYRAPEKVKVYEKIQRGVWSDKGFFLLIDAEIVVRNGRRVFDFYLRPIEERTILADRELPVSRLIPTEVKVAVWKRDHGKCVLCGSNQNLHYDHDLPYSRGGSSILVENVRLLCATHNLKKSAKIEAWLPLVASLAAFGRG
jgi:hypothetical protein